jgi:hypothetical protein
VEAKKLCRHLVVGSDRASAELGDHKLVEEPPEMIRGLPIAEAATDAGLIEKVLERPRFSARGGSCEHLSEQILVDPALGTLQQRVAVYFSSPSSHIGIVAHDLE